MAISQTGFADASASVTSLFQGIGAISSADLKSQGLRLDAQGDRIKAQGDIAEGSNYDLASTLATQNEQFTAASTAIKSAQSDRSTYQAIGGQQADVAGAGFAASGSALDLLHDSAAQGALSKAVVNQQGLITEAGYTEQAQSYDTLSAAAKNAAAEENSIADSTDEIANQTKNAGLIAGIGDFASSAIKGAASIAAFAAL
jgi:hypothetical protein